MRNEPRALSSKGMASQQSHASRHVSPQSVRQMPTSSRKSPSSSITSTRSRRMAAPQIVVSARAPGRTRPFLRGVVQPGRSRGEVGRFVRPGGG